MDRFKFRVWYDDEKFYYNNDELINMNIRGCMMLPDFFDGSLEGHIVEQCTGLKDENGKLIFEGDIVKAPDFWGENSNGVCVIGFNGGKYTVADQYGYGLSCIDEWYCDGDERASIEIIGNIHENQELMEAI